MLMRLFYPICRFFLFLLNPEAAHTVTFTLLNIGKALKLSFLYRQHVPVAPVCVMGVLFPNTVGLAAGLDKNGAYLDAIEPLGFGYIEIGTLTPRPQPGNSKPRMFRLVKEEAIINRMGFNNEGIDAAIENIKKSQYYKHGGIIGVNIGKNFDTPIEHALDDYLLCFEKAYPYASYMAINISSPNTPNLRSLQHGDYLDNLLSALKQRQAELAGQYIKYVPIVVKIAPDLTDEEIITVADKLLLYRMDGVILTNTTLSREGLLQPREEAGGLSGRPLFELSNEVLSKFAKRLDGQLPIFGVGGIDSGDTARQKVALGASLVQIYTGFIYKGPSLIVDCIKALSKQ